MDPVTSGWLWFICLGLAAGVFSGVLGVGSGLVLIPALVLLFGLGQKSAQGISLAVMVPMTLVGAIRYRMNPEVEMNTGWLAMIIAGALVGALLGAGWAQHLPEVTLRRLFAAFIIIVGVRMALVTG